MKLTEEKLIGRWKRHIATTWGKKQRFETMREAQKHNLYVTVRYGKLNSLLLKREEAV